MRRDVKSTAGTGRAAAMCARTIAPEGARIAALLDRMCGAS